MIWGDACCAVCCTQEMGVCLKAVLRLIHTVACLELCPAIQAMPVLCYALSICVRFAQVHCSG